MCDYKINLYSHKSDPSKKSDESSYREMIKWIDDQVATSTFDPSAVEWPDSRNFLELEDLKQAIFGAAGNTSDLESPITDRKFLPVDDEYPDEAGNDADDDLTDEPADEEDRQMAQFFKRFGSAAAAVGGAAAAASAAAARADDDTDNDVDDEDLESNLFDFLTKKSDKDAFALLPMELSLQDEAATGSLEDVFKDKLLISPPLVCLRAAGGARTPTKAKPLSSSPAKIKELPPQ